MNDAEIDALADQEFGNGEASGIIEQHSRWVKFFEEHKTDTRMQMIGAGLGAVLFIPAALYLAFESGRIYERKHPDSIKAAANPDSGEGIPYLPPRVRRAPVIVRPPVTPIEIPVGVDVDADSLVPIDWNTSSSS